MSIGKEPLDICFAGLNKQKVTPSDIQQIEKFCYENVRKDDLYSVRNDAKIRAVYSAQSYDEFR